MRDRTRRHLIPWYSVAVVAGLAACGDDGATPPGGTGASGTGAQGGTTTTGGQGGVATGGDTTGGSGGTGGAPPQPPPRIVIIYTPHGTVGEEWVPTGSGEDFELSSILAPLAPFKAENRLTVIDGLDLPVAPSPSNQHQAGAASLLAASFGTCVDLEGCLAGGPSLDRVIGGTDTLHPSIYIGADALSQYTWISHARADAPVPPQLDPLTMVEDLFGPLSPPPPELAGLETYAASLTFASPINELQNFLFAVVRFAFVHDVTRVAVVQLSNHAPTFTPLGLDEDYHFYTHDPSEVETVVDVQTWFAQQVADFAQSLQEVPTPSGNLLDETVILWISDMGSPTYVHTVENVPVVLIGTAGGRLRGSQFLTLDRNHVDLLLTLGRVFDPTMTTFGDPTLNAAPIDEILAP